MKFKFFNFGPKNGLEDHLALLKHFDVVLLIDDSASMSGRNWSEAERALIELAEVAAKFDDDGLEIYFLNSTNIIKTNDVKKIKKLFKTVKPHGGTPLGQTMDRLLKAYMERLKTSEVKIKPVNYIVITDGAASDPRWTENAIIDTARELDALNKNPIQIGIQFVQIGHDIEAQQFLEKLDDKLTNTNNGFIRDMVDTTLSLPNTKLDLVKVLLGGINRRVDKDGAKVLQ